MIAVDHLLDEDRPNNHCLCFGVYIERVRFYIRQHVQDHGNIFTNHITEFIHINYCSWLPEEVVGIFLECLGEMFVKTFQGPLVFFHHFAFVLTCQLHQTFQGQPVCLCSCRTSPCTGKTGRDHGTRFGGKQCPLLRSTRVSAGLRCTFIADSAQTAVRHLESVRSPRFSRHCTVRTPCITVRTPCVRLQTPYGLRVFSVRAPCVCLRRPNGLPYLMV